LWNLPLLCLNQGVPAKPTLPLSVCLIAGAEAARLRRALDSVAGWVEEIIVVINDDVADGTDQIAAACGAKVFREPWKGHIAQKNSAAQKAGSDWILGLDADEEISPALRAEIQKLFSGAEPLKSCVAFSLPRCTFFGGRWIRHGDWYPDRKVRLWRRGQAHWGGVNPHDALIVNGRVGKLRQDLLHHSMESLDHQIRKAMAYADDFARECAAQNRRVSWLEIALRPGWRFVRSFIFRLGFLDGLQGYVIARMTAFYTFLRYLKAREIQSQPGPRH
jgi:glycosyltransferase involved in cell wall biosynthesis